MHFPALRTVVTASAVGLTLGLTGCASKPDPMPEPEFPEIERSMDVGVNYIKPTSDIVIMDPSYQHVVLPDGARVAYRPGWEDEALAAAASALEDGESADLTHDLSKNGHQKIGKSSRDLKKAPDDFSLSDLPDPSEVDDPTYRAWYKLCDMRIEDMTDEEYQIVLNTKMPMVFDGLCDEGLRWLRELK